jgi:hypothetical protein
MCGCETATVQFEVRAMLEADAAAVAGWHYDGQYAFYDFEADAAAFLDAGLQFAAERFAPERFTLEVAAFNRRAITVYERAGFVEIERFDHRTNGGLHPFVRMSRAAR